MQIERLLSPMRWVVWSREKVPWARVRRVPMWEGLLALIDTEQNVTCGCVVDWRSPLAEEAWKAACWLVREQPSWDLLLTLLLDIDVEDWAEPPSAAV